MMSLSELSGQDFTVNHESVGVALCVQVHLISFQSDAFGDIMVTFIFQVFCWCHARVRNPQILRSQLNAGLWWILDQRARNGLNINSRPLSPGGLSIYVLSTPEWVEKTLAHHKEDEGRVTSS